jgi:hypothetical protein
VQYLDKNPVETASYNTLAIAVRDSDLDPAEMNSFPRDREWFIPAGMHFREWTYLGFLEEICFVVMFFCNEGNSTE